MGRLGRRGRSIESVRAVIPIDLARKHARILLIDDDPDALPLNLLREDGYNITQWEKLNAGRIHSLEAGEYDIVILDIIGIAGKEISESDGLGILDHIRRTCSEQVVIAFSGETFDIKQSSFFTKANDTLMKPVDFVSLTRTLDAALEKALSLQHLWESIRVCLESEGLPQRKIRRVERKVAAALQTGQKGDLQPLLHRLVSNAELALRLASLASRAVEIYQEVSAPV